MPPFVYICGAGPGDPSLLTLKAYRLISSGEVDAVVHDRLIGADVLALIPPSVERVYAGKACGSHATDQNEINALLVRTAREGKTVLRLKGGDPFVFGRGGEEMLVLSEAGIPFEIVPGVGAASAAAASACVPLTHRGVASGLRFVTGHSRQGVPCELDYAGLARSDTTIAVYMGLSRVGEIAEGLIAHGLSPDTPCLAVMRASLPDEKRLFSRLGRLAEETAQGGFASPSLIVIGEAVGLSPFWEGVP
jgi:uroporphyrin-III C-methyltransferase